MDLEDVYECHKEFGKTDDTYQKICRQIRDDGLMFKYRNGIFIGYNKLTTSTLELINLIYLYSELYHRRCITTDSFTVFRGVNNFRKYKVGDSIVHYIPFSTAIIRNSALDWLRNDNNSCLLEIKVSNNTKFLCINNDHEGKEIVLPQGILTVNSVNNQVIGDVDILVYKTTFTM